MARGRVEPDARRRQSGNGGSDRGSRIRDTSRCRRRRRVGARCARRAVGQDVRARSRPHRLEDRREAARTRRRARAARDAAQRQADLRVAPDRDSGGGRMLPVLCGLGRQDSRRDDPCEGQLPDVYAAGAGRCHRRDRAVELPAAPDVLESRARARLWKYGDHQAGESDAAHGAGARGNRARGGSPSGRHQRDHRPRVNGRPDDRRASGHRQDCFHRRYVHRQADHEGLGGDAEAHHPRTWRQVAEHRLSRRGHRSRCARRHHRHLLWERRGVRGGVAAAGRSIDQRRVHRQSRRAGEEDGAGRSARSQNAARCDLVAQAARQQPAAHRHREARRRHARGRRFAHRHRHGQGLLPSADGVRRRDA